MDVDLLDKILLLHKEQKWREILQLHNADNDVTRNILWVWPSESNLQFIKNVVQEFKLSGVISIGCGCGLFEWLLEQSSGFPVIGYEVNAGWWSSKYSNPQFIRLIFPEQPPSSDILPPNFALLFCYFNNGPAFRDYINCYKGEFVFIVGPGPEAGRHTDPEPFNPDFGSSDWILYKMQQVKDSQDFIAVYTRKNNTQNE